MNESKEDIIKLKLEIEELKNKNLLLEEKLKSYTNNHRHKKYYDNNSEIVKERARQYMLKIKDTNPEKLLNIKNLRFLIFSNFPRLVLQPTVQGLKNHTHKHGIIQNQKKTIFDKNYL